MSALTDDQVERLDKAADVFRATLNEIVTEPSNAGLIFSALIAWLIMNDQKSLDEMVALVQAKVPDMAKRSMLRLDTDARRN